MLHWEEYKRDNPDDLMYTQFCERYRSFKKTNQISLHIEHKAGEAMQVDWAGSTIPYTCPSTGEDKAADENMAGNVSRRIIAALRNRQFFSLLEINQVIKIELDKLINRPFQKLEGNRQTAFEAIDKPALKPLPS